MRLRAVLVALFATVALLPHAAHAARCAMDYSVTPARCVAEDACIPQPGLIRCPSVTCESTPGCPGHVPRAPLSNEPTPASSEKPFEFQQVQPKLGITIPTLPKFSDLKALKLPSGTLVVDVPWIGEYLSAVYKYLIPLGAIIAVLIIMGAGLVWMTSGLSDQKGQALTWIQNAVIGLLLLVGSYVILYTINPDLIRPATLRIQIAQPIEYVDGGDTDSAVTVDARTIPATGIICPKSGGVAAIPEIVGSMTGKVAYRLGGKGGGPPYSAETGAYQTTCPAGNICLDCSGFVGYVASCAGLPSYGGGTSNIFSSSEKITSIDYGAGTVNGIPLQAGDVLGWVAGESGKRFGHVVLFVGNGQVAESVGSGRNGGALVVRSFSAFKDARGYPFGHIKRRS